VHLEDNPENKIFVKFALCYGENAHKAVYVHSFAPKLQAVECFADG